jgi:hypothetical protein
MHFTAKIELRGYKSLKKFYNNIKALMAYACISSYSGGRDQEDNGLKPAQENSSEKSLHKKYKKSWWRAQGVGTEFKPQYHKEKEILQQAMILKQ